MKKSYRLVWKIYIYFDFEACNAFQKSWESGMFDIVLYHLCVWELKRTVAGILKANAFLFEIGFMLLKSLGSPKALLL